MPAPAATSARFERNSVQQLAARHLAKQAGDAARGQNETYICLRPFLIGQISSNIGSEAG